MEHQKTDYLASGMDRLVAKPIQIADLFAALDALVGEPEADEPDSGTDAAAA